MLVSLTATDRPDYLKRVIESWEKAGQTDFLFNVEPVSGEVREICEEHGVVVVNEERYGALGNPWHAFERGFAEEDFVILAEDDSIVSDDVLSYFAHCRDTYRDDDNVLGICAFRMEGHCEDPHHLTRGRFDTYVWATWSDRWENILRDTWEFDYRNRGWDWNIQDNIMPPRHCIEPCVSRSQHIGEQGAHARPHQFEDLQSKCFDPSPPKGEWHE